MLLTRLVIAGALVAAGFGTTAHADACNNNPEDVNVVAGPNASPIARVGVDDPTTGYPGVVVVCGGALGAYLQFGAGPYVYIDDNGDAHVVPMVCDPACHPL